MAKGFPGKEAQPHSRVNLSERLYEKKVDSFSLAESWQQRLRMRWLSPIDRVDRLGEPKLVQLGGWPSHYYKTSLATSFDCDDPRTFKTVCLKCNSVRPLSRPIM